MARRKKRGYPIGEALVVGLSAVAAGYVVEKMLDAAGVEATMPVATFTAAVFGHYTWRYVGEDKRKKLARKLSPKRLAS